MVRSLENGISLPPFLVKCYEMVSDETTNDLISWTESNDSFIIWDESKFSAELLPKYFKHGNFASFVRQLNIYGFRKIDTDRWQFANEAFVKGQKHLLKNISRRKNLQTPTPKKIVKEEYATPPESSIEEDKPTDLWIEVEKLKNSKDALMQELQNLRQHQENSQKKLGLLRQQLNGMEKNQQQMLSFIVMVMQSPEFMLQFFKTVENTVENSWRLTENGSSILSEVTEDCDPVATNGTIVAYQPPEGGTMITSQPPETLSYSDDLLDFDFSSEELNKLLLDFDFTMSPKDERQPLPLENIELPYDDASGNERMLEQLLLNNPSTEGKETVGLEDEKLDDSENIVATKQPNIQEDHAMEYDMVDTHENLQGLTKKLKDL